jgi:hypothetical protein
MLAQKLKVPIRCVLFTATPKLCEHNDTFRALNVGPEVSSPAKPPPVRDCRQNALCLLLHTYCYATRCGNWLCGTCKIHRISSPYGETPMLIPDLHQKTNRESRTILPHAAFSGFASRYREPKLSEGFAEIIKTDFRVRVIQDILRELSCRTVTWAD